MSSLNNGLTEMNSVRLGKDLKMRGNSHFLESITIALNPELRMPTRPTIRNILSYMNLTRQSFGLLFLKYYPLLHDC